MLYSYVQSRKPAVIGHLNGQNREQMTSSVDGDTEQPFQASRPHIMYHMFSYACEMVFNFELHKM